MPQPQTSIPSPHRLGLEEKTAMWKAFNGYLGTMWKAFNHGQETPPHVQSFLHVIPNFYE